MSAIARGFINPFRNKARAVVVVALLSLVTGFLALMIQAAFASREQIASLEGRVRTLIELRSTDKACCDDIYRVSVEKKLQLEHKIKALTAMSQALTRLIDMCSHDRKSLDQCPILGALEAGVAKKRGKAPKAQRKMGAKSMRRF